MKKACSLAILVAVMVVAFNRAPEADGYVADFWRGVVDGFISPVTFVPSLMSEKVYLYPQNNNGKRHTQGFLLGVVLFLSLMSAASTKERTQASFPAKKVPLEPRLFFPEKYGHRGITVDMEQDSDGVIRQKKVDWGPN